MQPQEGAHLDVAKLVLWSGCRDRRKQFAVVVIEKNHAPQRVFDIPDSAVISRAVVSGYRDVVTLNVRYDEGFENTMTGCIRRPHELYSHSIWVLCYAPVSVEAGRVLNKRAVSGVADESVVAGTGRGGKASKRMARAIALDQH